jgi:beta-phosphoglucomutase-like phosphatase (HAD superfamily)
LWSGYPNTTLINQVFHSYTYTFLLIHAAIFDMDGLLVDSEPHWRAAERDIFDTVGLHLTDDECKQTTGQPILDVVNYWYARLPWSDADASGRSNQQLADAITDNVHERIAAYAEPMPGAVDAVEFFFRRGIPTAIASASPMSLIEVVVDRIGIRSLLTLWHSATLEARNKPAPDVYLGTARRLGVLPDDCVAFEDSGSGLISARSAGMRAVAVPAEFEREDPKFAIATCKIPSLTAFDETIFDFLNTYS